MSSTGTIKSDDNLAIQSYSGRLLCLLLADLQLLLLLFPFASLFLVMPGLKGLEVIVNALSALLLVISIAYLFLMRKPHIRIAPCWPLFLFAFYLIFSVFWSDAEVRSNSISYTTRTVLTILQAFVIVVICQEHKERLFFLLKRFAIAITVLSLIFIILFPGEATWTVDDTPRVQSFFSSPNNFGQFLAFAVLVINFYKQRELPVWLLILLNAMLLYQFIRCDSMTSLAGVIIVVFCYHFRFLLIPLVACIVIAGIGVPHLSKLNAGTTESLGLMNRDLTFTGRSDVWDIMLYDLDNRDKEIWGFGSGGYWTTNLEEFNPVTTISQLDWDPGQGHNGYLDIIIMTGIIGFCFFLIFLLDFVRLVFKNTPLQHRVLYFLLLIIMFNNITESSFFRAKHLYFVLLMLVFWQTYLVSKNSIATLHKNEGLEKQLNNPQ